MLQAFAQRSDTPTVANAVTSGTLRFGGQSGGAANRFTGQIDEVVLFYGATSPTHAADLYASADSCGPVKVTLLEPSSGAVYYASAAIDLLAAATSQNGRITNIVYYSGATQIGSTYPGQTFNWGNVAPGAYTLTATAFDSTGASATSAPVSVNVVRITGNSTVSAQAPGTTFYTSGAVHLSASATAAPSYQIVEVRFFVDGVLAWLAFTPPYLFTSKNLAPGTHVITVAALDDAGYFTYSAPLTITVVAGAPSLVYYYNDAAGTPFAAADQYGTLVWNETYAPYGERYSHEDTGTSNGLWYTGKPVEDTTGLSYFGARWYNPSIGRFYSVDPQNFRESNPASVNRYAYANNNPYRFVDPDGKASADVNVEAIEIKNTRQPVTDFAATIAESALKVGNVLTDLYTDWIIGKGLGLLAVGAIKVSATVRNAHLAGKTHRTGIPFTAEGYPDFSSVAIETVKIRQTGNRAQDYAAANREAGLVSTPRGYTWHHHEDKETMQLVPTDIHRETGHTGGVSILNNEP